MVMLKAQLENIEITDNITVKPNKNGEFLVMLEITDNKPFKQIIANLNTVIGYKVKPSSVIPDKNGLWVLRFVKIGK